MTSPQRAVGRHACPDWFGLDVGLKATDHTDTRYNTFRLAEENLAATTMQLTAEGLRDFEDAATKVGVYDDAYS
ncbi:hypothetical protein [Bremerella alba]|uniref:hypothetical protein n=1 Tax=Bremerella alba TaxID=980252 RepID=UPI001A955B23|nr:hypothetical protein [Bremerella alba]